MLICEFPQGVMGGSWAFCFSSSHYISSSASPRTGPVAWIVPWRELQLLLQANYLIKVRGDGTQMWVPMCPHGFQLISTNCSLISFFPNSCSALLVSPSGPTEIEMTGLPPGAPGFHKQASANIFTNNHNFIHTYSLFHITHRSDMLPWLKPILHKYIYSMLEWKIFYIAPHLEAYQRTTEFHICVSID